MGRGVFFRVLLESTVPLTPLSPPRRPRFALREARSAEVAETVLAGGP